MKNSGIMHEYCSHIKDSNLKLCSCDKILLSKLDQQNAYWKGFLFAHFLAVSLRPAACGALSFQGKKIVYGAKIAVFYTGSYFVIFQ